MPADSLERLEFEKWAEECAVLTNGPYAVQYPRFTRCRENYVSTAVQQLWECWQAGYAKGGEAAT